MYGFRRDCFINIDRCHTYIQIEGYNIPINWKNAFMLNLLDGTKTLDQVIDMLYEYSLIKMIKKDIILKEFNKSCSVFLEEYPQNYIRTVLRNPKDLLIPNQPDISINSLPLPISMFFHVTDCCDKKCIYCFIENKKMNLEPDLLSYQELLHIIDQLYLCGINKIVMSGGEPFMRKDLFDIISYASNFGIWSLITTKHYFTEYQAKMLGKLGKIVITLSYDSHIPKIGDTLSGMKDHVIKMDASVRRLMRYGVEVEVDPIVTKYNINFSKDFLDYLYELGIRKVTFHPFQPIGHHIDNALLYNNQEWENFCNVINNYNKKMKISIYKTLMDGFNTLNVSYNFGCRDSTATICVRPNGNVVMCHLKDDKNQPCYGDLGRDTIKDVWNSPLRKALSNPPEDFFKNTPCEICEFLKTCSLKNVCKYQSFIEKGDPCALSSFTARMCSRFQQSNYS